LKSYRIAMVVGAALSASFAAGFWAIAMYWVGSATAPDCSDVTIKALCEPDWFARRLLAFLTGVPVALVGGLIGAKITRWVMEGE